MLIDEVNKESMLIVILPPTIVKLARSSLVKLESATVTDWPLQPTDTLYRTRAVSEGEAVTACRKNR